MYMTKMVQKLYVKISAALTNMFELGTQEIQTFLTILTFTFYTDVASFSGNDTAFALKTLAIS